MPGHCVHWFLAVLCVLVKKVKVKDVFEVHRFHEGFYDSRDKEGCTPFTYVYYHGIYCVLAGFLGIITHKYPLYRAYIGIPIGVRW